MVSKKMKYASAVGVGLLSLSLVACANETQKPITLGDSMTQNGIQKLEESPIAKNCKDYELQKDGSYKCNTVNGANGASSMLWFFNGMMFGNHSAMTSSSDYKAKNLINGTRIASNTKPTTSTKNTTSNSSKNNSSTSKGSSSGGKTSGFGSGGRGASGGS